MRQYSFFLQVSIFLDAGHSISIFSCYEPSTYVMVIDSVKSWPCLVDDTAKLTWPCCR